MGPEASNGVTGSMGLRADLAPPAGPDPLIVGGLAALAPSSWDLDTPANGAPGAPFVMVASVSRQFGLCGSSVEALSDTTERDSVEAVRRSVWRMFRVWDKTTARWRASLPACPSICANRLRRPESPPLTPWVRLQIRAQVPRLTGLARLAPRLLGSHMAPLESPTIACLMA